jgi:hypothetical protein
MSLKILNTIASGAATPRHPNITGDLLVGNWLPEDKRLYT